MAHRLGGTPQVDIAILTVIPPELFAARDALGIAEDARSKDEAGTVSFRGKVHSALARRDYEVVLTCIGRAGNVLSAAAVQDVIARYRPQAVLLVGIAAGIRGKVRIGEVVLSERVVSYEPAAAVRTPEGGSRLEPRPEIRTLPHRMQQDVVHYQPSELRLRERFEKKGGAFPRPPSGEEALYQEHVAARLMVKAATVASGEKLLRDPGKLLEVRTLHGKTEVGEMEAAGLMEACERSEIPWLAIRGISDFGDELKDDRFHEFASRAAATAMADFIEHGLELERRGRRGDLAVVGVVLLIAAMGVGAHTWAAQRQGEQTQSAASIASEHTNSKDNTKHAIAQASELAPAPSSAKDTRAQEHREKPPSAGDAKRREAVAPQLEQGTHAPEFKSTVEGTPTMKTKIGNVEAGNRAGSKAGNVQGQGSSDTQVGDVRCGDNCVIEIGNKVEEAGSHSEQRQGNRRVTSTETGGLALQIHSNATAAREESHTPGESKPSGRACPAGCNSCTNDGICHQCLVKASDLHGVIINKGGKGFTVQCRNMTPRAKVVLRGQGTVESSPPSPDFKYELRLYSPVDAGCVKEGQCHSENSNFGKYAIGMTRSLVVPVDGVVSAEFQVTQCQLPNTRSCSVVFGENSFIEIQDE